MIKQHVSSPTGMSKDLSSDKQGKKYFNAKNIRILSTDQKSTFAVTNEVGNELVFAIPTPSINISATSIEYTVSSVIKSLVYETTSTTIPRCPIEKSYYGKTSGTQEIIGTKDLRDSALIISTDGNGFDCFWELTNLNDSNFDLELLYIADLSLSKENLVQILYNYENSIIQKIYFVDGIHQLRYFNIRQKKSNGDSIELVDVDPSAIDVVSPYSLSQPVIEGVIGGGSHTSGMIQYSYGLYILNGSQTAPSPLSELISIDKGDGLGGGKVNEVLGRSVRLNIPTIDNKFTHIKIYSVKYTSYNQDPEIKVIADKEIDNFNSLRITDDGLKGTSVSIESYIFLGSNPIVPRHIATKDNRLFPINIIEQPFDVELDCRAFSFNSSSVCKVLDNAYVNSYGQISGSESIVSGTTFSLALNNDAINADYETYKYKSNGSTKGASGKFVEIELIQSPVSNYEDKKFLKDREIYRVGVKFYNRLGQTSEPKWVMDLKAPEGNLTGSYNQLRMTLTPNFYTWLSDSNNFKTEDDIPVGYKVIRADRTLTDQTIYAQGFINPMVANFVSTNKLTTYQERQDAVDSTTSDIIPSMTRMFSSNIPFIKCIDYYDLASKSESDSTDSYGNSIEGFKSAPPEDWRAQNFQHSRLMQFFSPDVLFRDNQIDSSFKLRVLGLVEQSYSANWSTETNPITGVDDYAMKFLDGITNKTPGVNAKKITGNNPGYLSDIGFFGPTNGDNSHATHQVFREFLGTYSTASHLREYDIYGTPEITNTGADFTSYNNDGKLRYSNNLKTMLMDDWRKDDDVHNDAEVHIQGVNTIGAKCITFAEGPDSSSFPVENRETIEDIHSNTGITVGNGVLMAEFVKNSNELYVGSMYGGMGYESKRNSSYIDVGSYNDINTNNVIIESPGDTFINTFTFTKLVKDNTEIKSTQYNLISEIVSIKVETTVDLKNRDDLSLNEWDNTKQPKYDEYQSYNNVYSQQPTLSKSIDLGSKIKKIQEFDGRLMSSKEKIPGEFIDSWTDFLENEKMDLDGKYGPINAVVNIKDEIYCLQDTGVAHIAINPRAQVQANDGISLELGTGGVLHDYNYKSTTSGCLNKWGVIASEQGFYYVDVNNSAIMSLGSKGVTRLSDLKGFHYDLLNRINTSELRKDNPLNGTGVSVGYNSVNSDIYFSFHQPGDSFTLGFNEKIGEFISYYDYVPSWYINKGKVMITTSPDNSQLWEHFKGSPNHFYGVHHASSMTLHIAPPGNEIILNSASYKMELTSNLTGLEVLNKGLTGVRVYNDYQDSGIVDLVDRSNVFKKFRNWKINFPRDKNSRDRVRSAWGFAEFEFKNPEGNKLILHDISIFFTQH
ncbi:hypothetical protein [Clostridium sp.]|jgi:hypothetical protein|uniref:hypothetical protein n=1 Tax=Clostridium sp. TaxID=1506 RepID=UPI003EEFD26B